MQFTPRPASSTADHLAVVVSGQRLGEVREKNFIIKVPGMPIIILTGIFRLVVVAAADIECLVGPGAATKAPRRAFLVDIR